MPYSSRAADFFFRGGRFLFRAGRFLFRLGVRPDGVEDVEIPGVVVSSVNMSPRFARELIDALQDAWSKWETRQGIKNLPEYSRDDDQFQG